MSTYVDYSGAAATYDMFRRPDGADIEIAMVQLYCAKPLKHIHILDAGCGTGNFAKVFLEHGTGRVTLLDESLAMLEKAKEKLEKEIAASELISIIRAKLPDIPLASGTVDAVLFNFVLHHLAGNPDGTTFMEIDQTIAEARRILLPGGVIVIMTVLPSIVMNSVWFAQLNTRIAEMNAKKYPTLAQFDEMFTKHNFQRLSVMNIGLTEMRGKYLTPDGPLDKDWRDFTTFWHEATEVELQEIETQVRKLKNEGTLQAYVDDHDKMDETGIFTLIFARAL